MRNWIPESKYHRFILCSTFSLLHIIFDTNYRTDLLPNYVTLLGLIQGNKGLVEEFRRVSLEKSRNESTSGASQGTLTNVQDPREAETVYFFAYFSYPRK